MSEATYAKRKYRRELRETVYIRRLTNDSPPYIDYSARARVVRRDQQAELVGSIRQYEIEAIVYADDLIDGGLAMPITAQDKLVVRSKVSTITIVDDAKRRVFGELIAFEIKALGQA